MGRMRYQHECIMDLTLCLMRDLSTNGMHGLGGWSMVGIPWEGPGMAGGRMGGNEGYAPRGSESVVSRVKRRALNSFTHSKTQILDLRTADSCAVCFSGSQINIQGTPHWEAKKEKVTAKSGKEVGSKGKDVLARK